MFKHPLTGLEYPTIEMYIDALANSYNETIRLANDQDSDQAILIDEFEKLTAENKKTEGRIVLEGTENQIEITRRVNVTYNKERGAEHPLLTLLKVNRWLMDLITIDVKEKAGIKKLLEALENGEFKEDSPQYAVANRIKDLRVTKQGKPTVAVVAKTGEAKSAVIPSVKDIETT